MFSMKKILYYLISAVIAAGVASCEKDKPVEKPARKFNVNLNVVSEISTRAAATEAENRVGTFDVFLFDAASGLLEAVQRNVTASAPEPGNVAGQQKIGQVTFTVVGEGDKNILAVANGGSLVSLPAIGIGVTKYADMLDAFAMLPPGSVPSSPFVMSGYANGVDPESEATLSLRRRVAKIAVDNLSEQDGLVVNTLQIRQAASRSWLFKEGHPEYVSYVDHDAVEASGTTVFYVYPQPAATNRLTLTVTGTIDGMDFTQTLPVQPMTGGTPQDMNSNIQYSVKISIDDAVVRLETVEQVVEEWGNGNDISAEITPSVVAKGYYDSNYRWTLDVGGNLIFTGSGDMENRYQGMRDLPWYSHISEIRTIVIPEGLSKIGRFTSGSMDNIFNTSSTLRHTNYVVDDNNPAYSVESGVLFNKDKTTLVSYPKGRTGAYTIPPSVVSIEQWAFSYCAGLSSVVMQGGLKNLSYYCFGYCTSLTSVTIPATVESTGGGWCFDGCTNLTSINVAPGNAKYASIDGIWLERTAADLVLKKCPEGREGAVTIPAGATIGYSSFSGCKKITSVNIPNSVVSIPTYAFGGCTNLEAITIPGSVTQIDNGAFSGAGIKTIYVQREEPPVWNLSWSYGTFNNSSVIVHVPVGAKANYEIANNWKDCADIVEDIEIQ